jgi:transposase-like protein
MRYKCPKCGQTGAGEEQDILPLCHSKSCNYKVTMLPEDLRRSKMTKEQVQQIIIALYTIAVGIFCLAGIVALKYVG